MAAYTFHLGAQGAKAGRYDSLRPVSLRPVKATQWEPVSTTKQAIKVSYNSRAGKMWVPQSCATFSSRYSGSRLSS